MAEDRKRTRTTATTDGRRGSGSDPTDPLRPFLGMASRYERDDAEDPRVVMAFPTESEPDAPFGYARPVARHWRDAPQVVDAPVGDGHVVMFSIRPFWRWQTQGTFFLGFNAILNWNDLSAGKQIEEPEDEEEETAN